jgi:hypothetical protein
LTSREKRTVERTLGSLLTEYGYKLDPAVPHRLDWLIADIAQQRVYRLKHFIGSTEKFLDEKPVLEKPAAMGAG